jgi:hypothetical protein
MIIEAPSLFAKSAITQKMFANMDDDRHDNNN